MSKEKGYRQRFEKLVIDFSRQSDRNIDLEAENKQLRDWLIEERLPNFCTGVECGCAERVGEARRKARLKLRQELEQALKNKT